MAESTGSGDSVGKISLDLEVTSDLSNQINKVSNTIGKKLKDTMDNATKTMFDGMSEGMNKNMQSMNSSLKNGLDKMKQNIRSTFTSALDVLKNIKMPAISFPKIDISKPNTSDIKGQTTTRGPPKNNINTEALKAEIDNTASALDIVNTKIEQQQAKLAQLKETYANTFNAARKNKIEEQILKTEAAINGLINKSDKLGFKLSDLDAKLASTGKGAGEAASKINLLGKTTGIFGSLANGTANMTKKLSGGLKELGSSSNNTNKHFNNMQYGLSNIMRQFFTWMIVLPLVMKGLGAITSFLGSAFMSNQQFATSLNQIKSNLYTAFAPIYNAVLPAINALMSKLATATAYIASFVNQLFGSTYEAGFKSAQNLQNSIGVYEQQEKAAKKAATALGSAGSAAKKAGKDAKSGLMGFDEINKLSEKTTTPAGSGVVDPITPMANMAPIEAKTAEWVKKFKDIMSKIFDPMKEAWANEGEPTMDSLKYALGSIWDLVKDIGKTFLDAWSNGTGVRVCTDILKLLQTIFNIIGDIATAFKTAWDKGDLGKQVVQALFNAFDSILKLLIDIGNTFREVWNGGLGVEICTNILEILKNIFTIIGQIADSFRNAWNDELGKQLVTDILNLLNGCLRVIKDITASFSKAWETNGNTIAAGILLILDDIVGTISDIANKWANAWENNGAGDTLMNSLLSTLGKILTTVGDIGKGIRESIGKAADTIFPAMIQFATDVSTGLGNLTDGFKAIWDNGGKTLFDGIVQLITQIANLILQLSSGVFIDFSTLFKNTLAPAIGAVFDVLGTVLGKLSEFVGWINTNKPIIDVLTKAVEGFMIAWEVTKIAAFIQMSGGLVGAITSITTALVGSTAAKIADGLETMAITAMYAGQFISSLVSSTSQLVAQAAQFTINTGLKIADTAAQTAMTAATVAWNAVCVIATTITSALGVAIAFLTSPIGLVVVAIGALIAIGVALYENWDTVSVYLSGIWQGICNFAQIAWNGLKGFFSQWGADILALFTGGPIALVGVEIAKHWDEISAKTSEIWNGISTWLGGKWDNFKTWAYEKFGSIKDSISKSWEETNKNTIAKWESIKTTLGDKWNELTKNSATTWNNLKEYMGKKWDEVNNNTSTAWGNITKTLGDKWNGIAKDSSTTWDNIKKYISDKWTEVNNDAPGLWDKIKGTLSGKWNNISSDSQGIWSGIVNFINNTFSVNWSDAWNNIVRKFGEIWDTLKDGAKGPVNAVIGLVNGLINGVNTAIRALNRIDIDIPDWVPEIGGRSFGFHLSTIGNIPALARGGIIDSPTLAMVGEAGKEAVVPLENNTEWMDTMSGKLVEKLLGVLGTSSGGSSNSDDGDLIVQLKIGEDKIGDIIIKQFRKLERKTGKAILNL